jgi:Tol biopolymer transport system component
VNGLSISAVDVRAQTNRVIASRHFEGSERLGQFLRHIVEETLEGRAGEIKEYVIGVAVYRKRDDFDPRIDSTVRVEASRLRRRLAKFYEDEGKQDAIIISVPKGRYVPAVEIRAPAEHSAPGKKHRFRLSAALATGVLLICAGVAWRLLSISAERRIPVMKEVHLTSLPGAEMNPSLSPDGEAVAFVWIPDANGESTSLREPSGHVFLVSVKGGSPRRLTKTDIGTESAPAWSPSGNQIALLGGGRGDAFIYLVSVIDGQTRKILAVPDISPETLSWSPDGRLLTYAQRDSARPFAVRTASIPDGERRQVTTPPTSILGDDDPAFSPDGRWIVFVRRISDLAGDLYLMPAGGGEARRITSLSTDIRGDAWMPDSHEIVFAAQTAGVYTLRRIRVDDHGVPSGPRPVADIGGDGIHPALVRPRGGATALTFARFIKSTNVWRADKLTPNGKLEFSRVAPSTRTDYDPSFSPDGSSIAFASNRSGYFEIWVCGKDGANPRQLTSFGGPDVGSPRWSPDGRHIAFDAQPGNNPDVYVVESDGGPVQRITSQPSDDARPSWSGDGRWIYFRSDRGGTRQIWKIRYTGRAEPAEHVEQVTTGTAHEAFESPDGGWVYFVRQLQSPLVQGWWGIDSGLWRVPTRGGPEEKVLDGVRAGAWAMAESGIFFVEPDGELWSRSSTLVRVTQSNPAAKVVVANIDRQMEEDSTAFAVSRDGSCFLLVFQARLDSDLFLVSDFR